MRYEAYNATDAQRLEFQHLKSGLFDDTFKLSLFFSLLIVFTFNALKLARFFPLSEILDCINYYRGGWEGRGRRHQ